MGKLKDRLVKLYIDNTVKPVAVSPRPIPYHLKKHVDDLIQRMIKDGIIEEHPLDEPAPLVSCLVITPKKDGELHMTLDARNINKVIQSNNHPIPRQEEIRAQLSGCK